MSGFFAKQSTAVREEVGRLALCRMPSRVDRSRGVGAVLDRRQSPAWATYTHQKQSAAGRQRALGRLSRSACQSISCVGSMTGSAASLRNPSPGPRLCVDCSTASCRSAAQSHHDRMATTARADFAFAGQPGTPVGTICTNGQAGSDSECRQPARTRPLGNWSNLT